MGNQGSSATLRESTFGSDIKANLQVHLSEEDYIPMSLTLRRSLVEGRRFSHVLPIKSMRRERKKERSVDESEVVTNERELMEVRKKENENLNDFSAEPCLEPAVSVEAKVTVVNMATVESKINLPISERKVDIFQDDQISSKDTYRKSPSLINRKYSLIDIKTGLKKSKFTLDLEERLRRSKLELGFDLDLNDWKEFSYKVENPEEGKRHKSVERKRQRSPERKRLRSVERAKLNLCEDIRLGKELRSVYSQDPIEQYDHNSQILGLCSVERPELFPNLQSFEPSIFKEELNQKNDLKELSNEGKHHDKESCKCDLCTLAYLTDMAFPEDHGQGDFDEGYLSRQQEPQRERTGSSTSSKHNGGDRHREKIRIVGTGNWKNSIEVSVNRNPQRRRYKSTDEDTSLNSLSGTSHEDCTNRKIKRLFRRNNEKFQTTRDIGDVKNNVSIVNRSAVDEDDFKSADFASRKSSPRLLYKRPSFGQSSNFMRHDRTSFSRESRKSSSSILGGVSSSSLSTIMSYRRVRQIFQTIIENNRPRKRTKKNIHKFRELQELGLGELKNNRWYPSDYKTASIWDDIHSSVQGVEARFKKYPKISSKLGAQK